jgi:hypothetical protein
MSKGYYRVDALRPDKRAGDGMFLRANSKEDARTAYVESRPEMSDWEISITRIKREEYPVDREAEEIVIPPHSAVIPGANDEDPSDEDDEAYNKWATEEIRQRLLAKRAEGDPNPTLLTRYPHDTVDDEIDSRDLVTLGRHDEVSIIDTGDR